MSVFSEMSLQTEEYEDDGFCVAGYPPADDDGDVDDSVLETA